MDILINSHNVELTSHLRDHVERKTARLDRYMPNINEVHVELSSQNTRNAGERQVAQITIRDDRGTILRAEERNSDMFPAVDHVIDKLYRQIKRYRGKRIDSRRSGGVEELIIGDPLPAEYEEDLVEESTADSSIVRRKQFSLRPMATEEAIEQMELLGHTFFVYFDIDDEAVNVVYKRHDQSYGLLQPTLD